MKLEAWKTTAVDHAIAEEFFGWKWMSFMGTPTREAEGYPEKRRVREFMSPEQLANPQWKDFFLANEGSESIPADDDPLSYRYCSSVGPAMVPHFTGHASAIADLEREIRRRGLWTGYRKVLWAQITDGSEDEIDEEKLADAGHEDRCIAAIALIGSRYIVTPTEVTE